MSMIQGLERPSPVPNELTKPLWDGANEKKLVLQNCTDCNRLHYPPKQNCQNCGSADHMEWKEVEGKGHVDVGLVIRDSRIRGFRGAQPINFVIVTLDEDPRIFVEKDAHRASASWIRSTIRLQISSMVVSAPYISAPGTSAIIFRPSSAPGPS